MSDQSFIPRSRVQLALAMLLTIVLGLFLRSSFSPFPKSVNKYGGDALWATVVYFGIGFLAPRLRSPKVAVMALIFAWSVEFSQLYQAPWIDHLRETIPGKLILGSVFNYPDLFAYVFGILLGLLIDFYLRNRVPPSV